MHLHEEEDKIQAPTDGMQLPEGLEQRLVAALKKEGLIRQRNPGLMRALRVAASIIILAGSFALGWFARNNQSETVNTEEQAAATKQYLLLTRNPDNFIADERQNQEYGKWVQECNEYQNMLWGMELEEQGWAMKGTSLYTYSSPDYAINNKGAISGFFVISAASDTQAIRIASRCPHLQYNGVLELRTMH